MLKVVTHKKPKSRKKLVNLYPLNNRYIYIYIYIYENV